MAVHATHVASLLFGQPGTEAEGVSPLCRALVVPVFSDDRPLSQVDLARAIEQAVAAGADVISVSGGQHADARPPDGILANALALCDAEDVLVLAAVGNDEPSACWCRLRSPRCSPWPSTRHPLRFARWRTAPGSTWPLAGRG